MLRKQKLFNRHNESVPENPSQRCFQIVDFETVDEEIFKLAYSLKVCLLCGEVYINSYRGKGTNNRRYCPLCSMKNRKTYAQVAWRKRKGTSKYRIQRHKYRNSDKGALRIKANRIKRRGVVNSFSYQDWMKKVHDSGGRCYICKRYVGEDKLELDHNPPICMVEKGHIYSIHDVVPLCKSCNSSKGKRTLEETKSHRQ